MRSGDGGSRTHVRKSGHTSLYMFSPSKNLGFSEPRRTGQEKPSSVKFRLLCRSITRDYPAVIGALLQTLQARRVKDVATFIKLLMHNCNCLHLIFFRPFLRGSQAPSTCSRYHQRFPSKPESSPYRKKNIRIFYRNSKFSHAKHILHLAYYKTLLNKKCFKAGPLF